MVALLTPFAATSNGFIFPHVSADKSFELNQFCSDHKDMVLDFYCSDHDDICCKSCINSIPCIAAFLVF
jgi:hypothetical protein